MRSRKLRLTNSGIVAFATGLAALLAATPGYAEGDSARGAMLAQQWCNSCHTVMKEDMSRKFDAGPRFEELAKKSESYLKVAIDRPHDFMPKFPKLSRRDKADLIAHIRSLR